MVVNDQLHQHRNDAQPQMKSVLKGFGDVSRQAIYKLLRHAGAYKSCTSGYRRAQLAKTLEYYKPINRI